MNDVVMGVDLGTQSIKVVIFDASEQRELARASHELELITRDDGSREQLADWWIEGFHDCLHRLPESAKAAVVAIGVSGQQHGFVPVSRSGKVLAPVKLWCDTATVSECEHITAAVTRVVNRLWAAVGADLQRRFPGRSVAATTRRAGWIDVLRFSPPGFKFDQPSVEVYRTRLSALARSVAADIDAG